MGRRISNWLFVAAATFIAAFNAYWVARGLATGAVLTLHKDSDALIRRAAEPGTFAINLGLRATIALLFGGWAAWLAIDTLKHRGQ